MQKYLFKFKRMKRTNLSNAVHVFMCGGFFVCFFVLFFHSHVDNDILPCRLELKEK